MIAVKGLMMTLPDGLTVNTLTECDLPFKLPSDTRLHRKYKRPMRVRHKRDIFNQLSAAFDGFGFDGIPCVKRMICEAQDYGLLKEKSLVQDLIYAIFSDAQEVGEKFSNYCHNATFSQCDVSFLHTIMEGTFTPEST
ncbi:PREDICTED: uncharacterized protein LOC108560245 [Nicrophorus vespilloides]|uniref:Uncharacterized protein LOC108560245 n=1 Tax=Nicrophorus vespilloides TaxID=110193 RepID=A0ABM1MF44_NICVS|nr:PREDICTED: uncharacterized protein LOC108560245 [Nicrophorus vespilloides]